MTTGHGQKWERKKEAAIAALLCCPTIIEAAKRAGVSEPTLHRWMRREDFKSEYQAARAQTLEVASQWLQRGTLSAVQVLQEIAGDKEAPSASRVMAARSFLESTGLLKGLAASVTVNNFGSQEEIQAALVTQLSSMLRTDTQLRAEVMKILADLEATDGNMERQN